MGKENPRKKLWVEAAKHFIEMLLSANGFTVLQKSTVELLDFFAREARTRKTARDRNKVWYEELRDYCVAQMLLKGIVERKTEHGTTYYKLVPNLKMGKDKDGLAKFDKLVDVVGIVEAYKLVNVTVRHFPAYQARVEVRDPRFHEGEELTQFETVEECTETEYTFVSSGSTRELLFWTVVMGNKPSFEVGTASNRAKAGKERGKR